MITGRRRGSNKSFYSSFADYKHKQLFCCSRNKWRASLKMQFFLTNTGIKKHKSGNFMFSQHVFVLFVCHFRCRCHRWRSVKCETACIESNESNKHHVDDRSEKGVWVHDARCVQKQKKQQRQKHCKQQSTASQTRNELAGKKKEKSKKKCHIGGRGGPTHVMISNQRATKRTIFLPRL